PITRTGFALCNPGQRRAIQVLIVNTGVNIGRRYGVNFPRRLTTISGLRPPESHSGKPRNEGPLLIY
ncbi:hypothetical protein, partial [Agrobacterium vitis]|uniref:hypothetical protein n=1 Tax=Agrobacterium vitis TaxID=373 RepID=UPI001AED3943